MKDERWQETNKWQQDMLSLLRVLRKIIKTTKFTNSNLKIGNSNNNHKLGTTIGTRR